MPSSLVNQTNKINDLFFFFFEFFIFDDIRHVYRYITIYVFPFTNVILAAKFV